MSMLQKVAKHIQCKSRDRAYLPIMIGSLKKKHSRKLRKLSQRIVREQLQ
jgi:hypothetical protein